MKERRATVERPTCKTCVFFDDSYNMHDEADLRVGLCRKRSPPTSQGDNVDIIEGEGEWARWSITYAHEWCGDHHRFQAYIAYVEMKSRGSTDEPRKVREIRALRKAAAAGMDPKTMTISDWTQFKSCGRVTALGLVLHFNPESL